MKVFFLIILSLIFIACPLFAADSAVDSLFEFGRRGSSGLVDEEDLTDEFNFSRYTVKAAHDIDPKNSFYAKYQYYTRAFDTLKTRTNNFYTAGFGTDNAVYSRGDYFAKIGPDFVYRNKAYSGLSKMSYDQIRADLPFILRKERDWTLKFTSGINSFIYNDAPKNEFRTNVKGEFIKKLLDEALTVSGFYKFQYVSRKARSDRYERNLGALAELVFESPFIKAIEGGVEHDMDNTKILYEEREDSYDYNEVTWYTKMRAALFGIFKDTVKFAHTRRNYADFNHNFDGNVVENSLLATIMEKNGLSCDVKLDYRYKQFRFPYVANPYSYHSHFIKPTVELIKKNDWRTWLGADTKFYRFEARRGNDKIYYTGIFGCEKYFLKKDLSLGFEYFYTYKNFLHKPRITEDLFKIRASYKF